MYVLTDGSNTDSFEVEIPYKAIKLFMDKYGSPIEDISIRTFGGTNSPASKFVPRSRPSSPKTNEVDVQLSSGDAQ